MSGPEAKAPPLRFMSSLEPWERKWFGEFATLRRGLTYTPADCREKGVRVLRSSNISEETFVLHNDDVFVSEQAANIPFVRNGDILITAANGSSHLVGKHALIDGVGEKDTVHGGFMLLAESDLPEFLDAAMSAPWYKQFVADYMMGGNGALGNLAKSSFDECTFLAPSTQHEQRRIGSLFRSLDALIAGREKALEKLEALKKSMLLKMFPQGDATVPEVRFKGFAGEWEKSSFDEMFIHIPSKAFQIQSTDYRESGQFPVVDQGKVRIVGYTDNAGKVFKAKDNPVIVFGDHTREVKFVDFDFVVGADGTQLLRSPKNDIQFMSYVVQSTPLPNMGYSRHFKFLQEATFLAPTLPEQHKIGAFFRSLDALLASRREEIGKLKQMKKALLERMFV